MNTKGLVELIVLNIGKDRKVLNDQTFAIMVLMALFTTIITTPIVMAIYKPARRPSGIYKHRAIERKDQGTELRMLACFHSSRNIPAVINLIEASRGTNTGMRLCVYALHLMELSERSSAIVMANKARKNGLPFWNKRRWSNSDHIEVVFETFQQLSNVSVRPTTAISALTSLHEDICASAETKRAAMIIIPFHKHQRVDGTLETTRTEFRNINKKVLEHAPCSVGILVDRGLGGTIHVSASNFSSSITVLFFGGHDDREALAYGTRMAEHPGVQLTVICFSWDPSVLPTASNVQTDIELELDSEKQLDGEFVAKFRKKASKDDMVNFEERVVRCKDEVIGAIQAFSRCSLFLVGRNPNGMAAAVLMETRSECHELGPVGSLLTLSVFSTTASVLIVQQYTGHRQVGDLFSSVESLRQSDDESDKN